MIVLSLSCSPEDFLPLSSHPTPITLCQCPTLPPNRWCVLSRQNTKKGLRQCFNSYKSFKMRFPGTHLPKRQMVLLPPNGIFCMSLNIYYKWNHLPFPCYAESIYNIYYALSLHFLSFDRFLKVDWCHCFTFWFAFHSSPFQNEYQDILFPCWTFYPFSISSAALPRKKSSYFLGDEFTISALSLQRAFQYWMYLSKDMPNKEAFKKLI